MEFFERIEQMGHRGKKGAGEKATEILARLAAAIADSPDASELDPGNFTALFVMRMGKAKRAYAKALHAMAEDDPAASTAHAERGLIHFQIASAHGRTVVPPLSPNQLDAPIFAAGSLEENIERLAASICRIKLLVEYKDMEVPKGLRERLSQVVQSLQDAIEDYSLAEHTMPLDTTIGGIIWCQYIYARLSGDALYPPKQMAKTMRALYQLALEAGLAAFEPVTAQTKEGREKTSAVEEFLQSALVAYLENDLVEMDRFVRLGAIQAGSLSKLAARAKTKELVKGNSEGVAADAEDGQPSQSFKQIVGEIRALIDGHYPQPDRALVALEALELHINNLKRAMRGEYWREARRLLQASRQENDILSREIGKIIE